MADLASVDTKWENLTEVYQNSTLKYLRATATSTGDTTGNAISNLQQDDGLAYDVTYGKTLSVALAAPSSTYSGLPITGVTLRTKYSVGANFTSTNNITWSIDGTNYYPTTIKPASNQANVNLTFDLKAAG